MNINDIIEFGAYPQVKYTDERQPLKWRVIDIDGDKALLLTDKVIENVRFNEKYADATWETSILRNWMNGEFFENTFSEEEQKKIIHSKLTTADNPRYGSKGGNDTVDKVFALSEEELEKYFPDIPSRKAEPTPKALEHNVYVYTETGYATWWLRSMGYVQYAAERVGCGGKIAEMIYDDVRAHHGTRPAVWIRID